MPDIQQEKNRPIGLLALVVIGVLLIATIVGIRLIESDESNTVSESSEQFPSSVTLLNGTIVNLPDNYRLVAQGTRGLTNYYTLSPIGSDTLPDVALEDLQESLAETLERDSVASVDEYVDLIKHELSEIPNLDSHEVTSTEEDYGVRVTSQIVRRVQIPDGEQIASHETYTHLVDETRDQLFILSSVPSSEPVPASSFDPIVSAVMNAQR